MRPVMYVWHVTHMNETYHAQMTYITHMTESCHIQQGMMQMIGMQPGMQQQGVYPGQMPGQMPMGATMHGACWFAEFDKTCWVWRANWDTHYWGLFNTLLSNKLDVFEDLWHKFEETIVKQPGDIINCKDFFIEQSKNEMLPRFSKSLIW